MRNILIAIAALSLFGAFAACETEFDYEADGYEAYEEAPMEDANEMRGPRGECLVIGLCVEGFVWSDRACRCLPEQSQGNQGGQGGEACGPTVCGAGLVCCNASCGICTEPGGFCIQIACEPEN